MVLVVPHAHVLQLEVQIVLEVKMVTMATVVMATISFTVQFTLIHPVSPSTDFVTNGFPYGELLLGVKSLI